MVDDDLDDLAPFWEEARQGLPRYERGCEYPLRLVPEKDQPRSAKDLLRLAEQRGGDFRSFRERHKQLCSRLKLFVGPVVTTGKLVNNVMSASSPLGPPATNSADGRAAPDLGKLFYSFVLSAVHQA